MRLFHCLGLLAALIPDVTAEAESANLDIWDIDSSCSKYNDASFLDTSDMTGGSDQRDYVQTLFDRVLLMALAAQKDIEAAIKVRPSKKSESDYRNWERVADNLVMTLGFAPKRDKTEEWSDTNWRRANRILGKMANTLQSTANNPSKGFNLQLSSLPGAKPLFVCGENFEWLGPNSIFPPEGIKVKDVPLIQLQMGHSPIVGGWYKKRRWFVQRTAYKKPIFCERGRSAVMVNSYDMIVMCDVAFTEEKSRWVDPSTVKEGFPIGDIMESPEVALFHELTRWYSGMEGGDSTSTRVKDATAVDSRGRLLYEDSTGKTYALGSESDSKIWKLDLEPILAYSTADVFNLAKKHTFSPGKSNTGPDVALKNAQSLTMFAAMSYHSDWVWRGGKAKKTADVFS